MALIDSLLAIHLFGPPVVLRGGQLLEINRRKSRAVLFYLAESEQPVRRERLLSIFWPDLDRQSAQQTLRTTLHGLRRMLGDALLVEGETLALTADVLVDTRRFSALLSPGEGSASLSQALDLYGGVFLQDFDLEDSGSLFEEWLLSARPLSKQSRSGPGAAQPAARSGAFFWTCFGMPGACLALRPAARRFAARRNPPALPDGRPPGCHPAL
jgi:DNA-binding SARP family transcriptional activator